MRNLPFSEPPAEDCLWTTPACASEFCHSRLNGCTIQATGELQFCKSVYMSSLTIPCGTSGRVSNHRLQRPQFSLAACERFRARSGAQVTTSLFWTSQQLSSAHHMIGERHSREMARLGRCMPFRQSRPCMDTLRGRSMHLQVSDRQRRSDDHGVNTSSTIQFSTPENAENHLQTRL